MGLQERASDMSIARVLRPSIGWVTMPLGRKPKKREMVDVTKFEEAINRFRLIEAADSNVETLYAFDMDDTLLHHPSQKGGMAQWKRLTGRDWPHGERWWSISATLKPPFKFDYVKSTRAAFMKAKSDPKGKVIVMTGRLATPGFKETIPELLYQLGFGDFKYGENLFLKRTNEHSTLAWKKKMIAGFAKRYVNVKAIHMWDDRGDHVTEFAKKIKKLGLRGKVTHVQEPTPAHVTENFPNRPDWSPQMFALEPYQISPAKTPKQPNTMGGKDEAPKPMKNKRPGNIDQRAGSRAGGTRWHNARPPKQQPSTLMRATTWTKGRGDTQTSDGR